MLGCKDITIDAADRAAVSSEIDDSEDLDRFLSLLSPFSSALLFPRATISDLDSQHVLQHSCITGRKKKIPRR